MAKPEVALAKTGATLLSGDDVDNKIRAQRIITFTALL